MKELSVSSPWVTYVRKIEELFGDDPAIGIKYDNDSRTVTMHVDGSDKADAIARMIPGEVEFGNVKLKVSIVPSNDDSPEAIVRKAFSGNPVVSSIETVEDCVPMFGGRTYVSFKPHVVQFFNDDMSDPNGVCSTLYQDIAREVLDADGVSFCTALA